MKRFFSTKGFSLVEVTVALGVFSFSLLALVGLLPHGLSMVKNANDRSAAVGALSSLTDGIRNGSFDGKDSFRAVTYPNLSWQIGLAGRVDFTQNLTQTGLPAADDADEPRLVARVELTPPASQIAIGQARVSIAWPATATWDADAGSWRNAEGSITQGIMFVPKL